MPTTQTKTDEKNTITDSEANTKLHIQHPHDSHDDEEKGSVQTDKVCEERDKRSGAGKVIVDFPKQVYRKDSITKTSDKPCIFPSILKSLRELFANLFYEKPPTSPYAYRVKPKVMLEGCSTVHEHYERIDDVLQLVKNEKSLKGLEMVGFTYVFIPCESHPNKTCTIEKYGAQTCQCGTRLKHIASENFITKENRLRYISDGPMYEVITRLCQEYAQELMMKEATLHWVSVCEDITKGNPIRILVDQDYPVFAEECHGLSHGSTHHTAKEQDDISKNGEGVERSGLETFLITTGKGKVRAGVFSRQHLLISSIESSTALPMVRDAKSRNMNIAILDPNARGDRVGMATYEQSMRVLFGNKDKTNTVNIGDVYILAHSASGSQLTRYLQTNGEHILPRIKAIAFTDSNHSIQWLKNHSHISSFFESDSTIYVRSSNEYRDEDWKSRKPGDVVNIDKDENWLHRFGRTFTIEAGTSDHSLINFTSHHHIWKHFDRIRTKE